MRKIDFKKIFEIVLRQCVFIILNIYALSKIFGGQFYMKGKLPLEVAETTIGEQVVFRWLVHLWDIPTFVYSLYALLNLLELGFCYGIKQSY